MLRSAIGVDRILSAADELPLVALDQLGLVESKFVGPGPGVDCFAGGHLSSVGEGVGGWFDLSSTRGFGQTPASVCRAGSGLGLWDRPDRSGAWGQAHAGDRAG